MNTKFQRIARRGKKAFLTDQCKEIEENNRVGKTRDLFKNIKVFDCVHHSKLWKILKEMGIPDHLTCLLRNLYAGQEATIITGHRTTDWF